MKEGRNERTYTTTKHIITLLKIGLVSFNDWQIPLQKKENFESFLVLSILKIKFCENYTFLKFA